MAAVTLLGAATLTTQSGSKTVTATPAVGDLIVIVTAHSGNTSAATPTDDQGGTYVTIVTSKKATNVDTMMVHIRTALIPAATSTIFTHAPGTTTGGGLAVLKVTGMTRLGADAAKQNAKQENQASGATPAPVFAATPQSGNPVIGAVFNATSPATMTPRSSPAYTEQADVGYSTPTTGLEVMSINSGETSATITWGSTSASAFCDAVVELNTSVVHSGAAILSGAGTLAAIGAAIWKGVSALVGSGVLAAVGSYVLAGAVAFSGSGSLAAAGTCEYGGAAALSGEAILAASGTVIEAPGSAGTLIGGAILWQKPQVSRKLQVVAGLISGSGGDGIVWPSWGTTGGGEVSGAAALGGQGALAAVGSYVHAGATVLTGNGTLAAVGAYIHQGAAGLSGEGTVAAAGARLYAAQSALSGEGTIVAAPRMDWAGKAALTGEGVLAATGSVGPEVFGAAALGGQGTLAAVGSYLHAGASALGGNGTLAGVGTYLHKGAAALTGEGTVVAAARLDWAGKIALSGEGIVRATGALEGPSGPAAPSVSEYLKECWEDTFRPLLGKKPWPFRLR